MKNIMILGVPRAGKSTFTKMLLKEFPNYNIIQEDIIASSYRNSVLNATRERNKDSCCLKVTYDMYVVYKMLEDMFDYSIKYEPKLNFILDAMSVPLKNAAKYNKSNTIVLVFGYPNITVEEGIYNVRKYDTEDDWTFMEPEYRIRELFKTYIKISKDYQEECKNLGLKFVDTSKNRKEVLDELFNWIKTKL